MSRAASVRRERPSRRLIPRPCRLARPDFSSSFLTRVLRWPARLAVAGLLVAGGTLALAAPAAADVLVSNIGQTQKDANWNELQYSILAQGFTTGSNSSGYALESVDVNFQTRPGSSDTVTVKLARDSLPTNTNTPQTVTLTNPSRWSNGNNTFAAPAGTTLDASTTYYVVVDAEGGVLDETSETAEDSGGFAGWSIGDGYDTRGRSPGTTWHHLTSGVLLIRINGTAKAPNAAPTVATEIPDQRARAGTAFGYTFPADTFSDADSDPLSYTARSDGNALPEWLTFTAATRTFSGTPAASDGGTVQVTVTASDGALSVSDTFAIKVHATDVCDRAGAVRDAIVAAVSGVDDCADLTPAQLAAVAHLDLSGNSLASLQADDLDGLAGLTRLDLSDNALASLPAGVFDLLTGLTRLDLNDNALASLPADVFEPLTALTRLDLSSNTGAPFGPTARAGADRAVSVGATVTLRGGASGPWGGNVTWQWTQVDGASSNTAVADGVTLTGATSAEVSFTAPAAAATLHFRLVATPVPGASSARGTATGADWVTVTVSNFAPTVAKEIPNQFATVGTAFSYAFPANTFDDAEGDTLAYTAARPDGSTLPTWLTFTAATRTFSGTPGASDKGTVSVKVTASDGTSSASDTFDIKVHDTDVCARTRAVRDAIVGKVSGVSDCADLTPADLAAITGGLPLSRADLASLKAGDFGGLSALEGLNLSRAELTSLPPGVFDELTKLRILYLTSNSLTSLPPGVFDRLANLERLNLNDNDLASLPPGVFDKLTNLTKLELRTNSLTSLPPGVFDELTKLEWLHLSSNDLASLPPDVFEPLTALTELYLSGNPGWRFAQTANAGADRTVSAGATVTLSGTASGPWGGNVAWQWTQVDGADSNTAVDAAAAVTLTGATSAEASFTAPATAATLHFRVVTIPVHDLRDDSDTDWVTLTVSTASNNAPTVSYAIPDQVAIAGTAFGYAFPANTFSDADGDTLTYAATLDGGNGPPTWLTFTAGTRTFSGTPTASDAGTVQ